MEVPWRFSGISAFTASPSPELSAYSVEPSAFVGDQWPLTAQCCTLTGSKLGLTAVIAMLESRAQKRQ